MKGSRMTKGVSGLFRVLCVGLFGLRALGFSFRVWISVVSIHIYIKRERERQICTYVYIYTHVCVDVYI